MILKVFSNKLVNLLETSGVNLDSYIIYTGEWQKENIL